MNRRSFFSSLAKAAGIVALAPSLAFRTKLQVEAPAPFWFEEQRATMTVDDNYLAFIAHLEAKTFQFPPSFQDFLRENRLHNQQLPAVQLHQAGRAAASPAGS